MLTEEKATRTITTSGDGPGNGRSAQDDENFWKSLLRNIKDGNVVPVIGPELLTVDDNGSTKTFYRVVAEILLKQYGVALAEHEGLNSFEIPNYTEPVVLRRGLELMDAVCAIHMLIGTKLNEFNGAIYDIIETQVDRFQQHLPAALTTLAEIKPLHLFITTTPDYLLTIALNHIRHQGGAEVEEIEYALNLSRDRKRDIDEAWKGSPDTVFYLFGKTSAAQFNAIHEEDMLEWIYNLQQNPEAGPERLLNLIREKQLLFIGCPVNDWLGRFLVRTSNTARLGNENRNHEFMVFDPQSVDRGFKLFLQRFSKQTKLRYQTADQFVEELQTRWKQEYPENKKSDSGNLDLGLASTSLNGSIFISYASQDVEAAQVLYEQLKVIAGGDVVWMDKRQLQGGDDWEHEIIQAIKKECKLFVPLISRHTVQRSEGEFRREWLWAEQL